MKETIVLKKRYNQIIEYTAVLDHIKKNKCINKEDLIQYIILSLGDKSKSKNKRHYAGIVLDRLERWGFIKEETIINVTKKLLVTVFEE